MGSQDPRITKVVIRGISTADGGVQKFPVSVMPDEVLEGIDIAQSAAEVASNATTTAETAQSTATAAKTAAEAAMPMTGGDATGPISVVRGTYKCTVGADKYAAYGFKISYVSNGVETENACFAPGGIFIDTSTGKAAIDTSKIVLGRDHDNQIRLNNNAGSSTPTLFAMSKRPASAGSASEIVITTDGEIRTTAGDIEIKNIGPTFNTKGSGIILKSDTPGSHKKFRISVDDTGAISATEVTT